MQHIQPMYVKQVIQVIKQSPGQFCLSFTPKAAPQENWNNHNSSQKETQISMETNQSCHLKKWIN